MDWITATDLKAWAATRQCQELLPELVHRLVRAGTRRLIRAEFPAGDSVQTGGWDGICETEDANNTYVPAGCSGWEFGVATGVKAKATDDYRKRTDNPAPLEPSSSTFIFVTARAWTKKHDWITDRQKEGVWSDVHGYNADDLASWIRLHPAVGAWLASILGKYAGPIQTLDELWYQFTESTTPSLTTELVTTGRHDAVAALLDWQAHGPSTLFIEADAQGEAAAFVAAVDRSNPEFRVGDRTLASSSIETLRSLANNNEPLVLIWMCGDLLPIQSAVAKGHHVVVPVAKGDALNVAAQATIIRLPNSSRQDFADALEQAGLPKGRATKLAGETGRSITRLQRQIPSSASPRPAWSKPPAAVTLIPALLVGHWVDNRDADRDILQKMGATDYATWDHQMAVISRASDSPVRKIGEHWNIVSPTDAWQLLASYLTADDLTRFGDQCTLVLGQDDPALAMPASERWMASVHKKDFPHSAALRHGLAQTLALLSAKSELNTTINLEQHACVVVQRMLSGASPARWYSLSSYLRLLAEAAPTEFLDAVEADLARPQPHVASLFVDETGPFASYPQVGLLWALESLAWYPEHLGRVAVALARLANLDPGSNSGSRPQNSLADIFLSWRRGTTASPQQRLEAIELVLTKVEAVGWQLLLDIMPRSGATATETCRPTWREMPVVAPVTVAERVKSDESVVALAISYVGTQSSRLVELINLMGALTEEQHDLIRDQISQFDEGVAAEADRRPVWDALRDLINNHREFPDADWSLPEETSAKFDELMGSLEPDDLIDASVWLFDNRRPYFPVSEKEFGDKQDAVERIRRARLTEVLERERLDGIYRLAQATDPSTAVAETLTGINLSSEMTCDLARYCLGNADTSLRVLGVIQVSSVARSENKPLLQEIQQGLSESNHEALADFYRAQMADSDILDLVERSSSDVRKRYWANQSPVAFWKMGKQLASRGIRGFLDHARADKAFSLVAHEPELVNSDLIVEVLDALASEAEEEKNGDHTRLRDISFVLNRTLACLRQRPETERSELLRLEWLWLPFLREGMTLAAPTLQTELLDNPVFFCRIITLIYPEKNDVDATDEAKTPTDLERRRAHQAYELLSSLRRVPGQDGANVDSAVLAGWVAAVRKECLSRGNLEGAELSLGNVLAAAPTDLDGMWPHRAVRDVLEQIESTAIESTLVMGFYNQGGVTCRAPDEGGAQEHATADQYQSWSEEMPSRWPRASVVLRELSKLYRNVAKHHDIDAELRDLD